MIFSRLPTRLLVGAIAALSLSGCGQGVGDGAIRQTAPAAPEERLTALTMLDQRVARVAHALSIANVDLCPTVRQSAGWALHAASQYSPPLRPHARARFGLDGDLPGILAAPSASAAAQAGLREGDLVLSVNGQALNPGPDRDAAVFEGLGANIALLDQALAAGPAVIGIRRGSANGSVTVVPQSSCGYEVQLNPSDELNARADGRRLFITTALAEFAQTDDELAIVLGHELAHHVLRHRTWDNIGGAGRMKNEAITVDPAGSREQQADRVGLYLSARAGYETAIAPAFWRRFGAFNWRVRYRQLRHDSAETRARALEAVQAEIEAKRARGEALLP